MRRVFMLWALRRFAKPECISAAMERAIARAPSSNGQNLSPPDFSLRYSMIARLSQTTVSPSHRIGTLPDEGANSSPSRLLSQSSL